MQKTKDEILVAECTEEIRVSLDAVQDEYDTGMSRLREKIQMGNDQVELPKIMLTIQHIINNNNQKRNKNDFKT